MHSCGCRWATLIAEGSRWSFPTAAEGVWLCRPESHVSGWNTKPSSCQRHRGRRGLKVWRLLSVRVKWSQAQRPRGTPNPRGPLASPRVPLSLRLGARLRCGRAGSAPDSAHRPPGLPRAPRLRFGQEAGGCGKSHPQMALRITGRARGRFRGTRILFNTTNGAHARVPRSPSHTQSSFAWPPSAPQHPDLSTPMFPVSPCGWTKWDISSSQQKEAAAGQTHGRVVSTGTALRVSSAARPLPPHSHTGSP